MSKTGKNIGAPIGNTNAEKWTEEEALKIAEELLKWLLNEDEYYDNVYFEKFLMIKKGLGRNTINYLCNKFELFRDYIKEAKNIQELKLTDGSLKQKYSTASALFQLKAKFGYNENTTKREYDFEKQSSDDITHFLTMASEITNVYLRNIEAVKEGKKILLNRGGTRSGKTHSVCQIAKDFLFTGKIGEKKIEGDGGVFRKTLPALKMTFLNDFLKLLDSKGIDPNQDLKWNKTDKYFEYDGRKLHYGSLNNDVDIKKARGLGLGLIILNEANEMALEAYNQLIMRSRANAIIILDFNPDDPMSYVNEKIEKERSEVKGDVALIHSTYKDNKFLPQDTIDEIEYFRDTDPDLWAIYGGGIYGGALGRVYNNWEFFDDLPPGDYLTVYGQDFGFSNSYDAIVEINYNKGTKELYIKEKLYEKGLLHNVLTAKTVSIVGSNTVFADCNESRMLTDIMNANVSIYKPKKDRKRQLELSKSFKIFIHSSSVNLEKERKTFVYLKDNLGKLTNDVIEVNDHLIKAFHYGVTGLVDFFGIDIPKIKG